MGGVAYMPGVYKIYMVRMTEMSDELVNVRVYTAARIEMCDFLQNGRSEQRRGGTECDSLF